MNQLQSFVNRMCRHPILSQSDVWSHFLSCTDEKRWKNGKRKAEKDPLVVVKFFFRLEALDACVPETPVYVLLKIMVHRPAIVGNFLLQRVHWCS